jgi:hypothetical protein
MQTRTAVLIGLVGLAGGWLARSTSAPTAPSASQAPAAQRRGPRPLGSEPAAPVTEQLQHKLQAQPRSPSPGRNPFVFSSRRPSAAMARPSRSSGEVETPAMTPQPPVAEAPRVRFALSGIAASTVAGGTNFTAILTDNGALVFAKAGDTLADGSRVAEVNDASVVLVDAAGTARTLRLK